MCKINHTKLTSAYCPDCGEQTSLCSVPQAMLAHCREQESRCRKDADNYRNCVAGRRDPDWVAVRALPADKRADKWKLWAEWLESQIEREAQ